MTFFLFLCYSLQIHVWYSTNFEFDNGAGSEKSKLVPGKEVQCQFRIDDFIRHLDIVSITLTWNVYLQSTMASLTSTSTQLVIDWPECTNQLTIFFNEHNDAVSETKSNWLKDTKDIPHKQSSNLSTDSSCKYQQGSLFEWLKSQHAQQQAILCIDIFLFLSLRPSWRKWLRLRQIWSTKWKHLVVVS